MQRIRQFIAAGIFGLLVSGFVQAAALGSLSGELEVERKGIKLGFFEDTYSFSVASDSTLIFEVDKREKITGLSLFVHGATDKEWKPLGNETGPISLFGGNNGYYFKVSGTSTSAKDSRYRLDLTVTALASSPPPAAPVPEPAEWAMLLAGFLVMGFIVRRRHRRLL